MNANLALFLEKEYDGHAQPNTEMAEETKGAETCMSCFICCWIGLSCTLFLFQPFTGKLEPLEDASLHCFQLHHLPCRLVRTGKGKPDGYSVVSFAAFATMSLGLSDLTQFGFQIDLLYFFCGGLLVQLMKIKLWLVTVGGGFTYSLLQLRYYPSDSNGENLRLENHNQVIIQVNDSGSVPTSHEQADFDGAFGTSSEHRRSMSQEANVDVDSALATSPEHRRSMSQEAEVDVDSVLGTSPEHRRRMSQEANADVDSNLRISPEDGDLGFQDHPLTQSNSPSQDESVDDGLIIQQQLMNCIKELEKENKMLVPFVCSHVDKYLKAVFGSKEEPYADVNMVLHALPTEIMRRLKEIVKLTVDAGFAGECSDIYSTWRRTFVEQCLRKLRLEFQTSNNKDVTKWSKTCKAVCKIFFPNERRLCDYLFSGLSVAGDVSFEKVCKRVTIVLLEFTHITITTKNYSRNLLFNIVPKMLESLGELEPNFIPCNNLSFVPDLGDIQQLLAMVNNFRDIIYPGNVQAPVTHKEIHLFTKESMNYICRSCVVWTKGRAGQSDRVGNSSFWVVIGRMVDLLESELEAISKDFYAGNKDHYLFMVSCLCYISERTHDFKMDNEWFQQRRAKVTRNLELYAESLLNEEISENKKHFDSIMRSYIPAMHPEDKKTV
ncbi:uncharacterized protein LOC106752618 [Vigna radiata var. radiata]|uniref:Exocyst subunit Exo70 family protein n=1 Tax=Vigna radiata var. radiata TaxID=3916 RepID=A0A3Q0ERR6_VIGRR|nr:uncharacterized protein LOC106752618 [Vigna radiata var. radiata]XP_022632913.1 uncharacterized protein LOC106752618 [Vigna radiata var. radiata]